MSRIMPVLKREFVQTVASRKFLIGTIIGPLLMVAIVAMQFVIIAKGGGGAQRIAIVDASGRGMAPRVAAQLREREKSTPSFISRATYNITEETAAAADHVKVTARLTDRVLADSLDGFLWLPAEAMKGEGVRYEGSNATNTQVMNEIRGAVQRTVQSERLKDMGVDESTLGSALAPVRMDIAKTGKKGEPGSSSAIAAKFLAMAMAFAIYIVVILYGQSIMSSVQEEKRDRVVELIVSSIRARDLLVGKVVGIGAAGVLQIVIWVAAAGVLFTYGGDIASKLGASQGLVQALSSQSMPHVPLSTGIIFIIYFAGGFFLYATLFALVGAIVTNAQEAQQFVFPVIMPLMLGFFAAMPATDNPNNPVAVIASMVPFTSPMVMPIRASLLGVNWLQLMLSIALLYGTGSVIIWLAGKIYRTAIFATGKKPSMREVMHWMKSA